MLYLKFCLMISIFIFTGDLNSVEGFVEFHPGPEVHLSQFCKVLHVFSCGFLFVFMTGTKGLKSGNIHKICGFLNSS